VLSIYTIMNAGPFFVFFCSIHCKLCNPICLYRITMKLVYLENWTEIAFSLVLIYKNCILEASVSARSALDF
jgi:hypothetical protein